MPNSTLPRSLAAVLIVAAAAIAGPTAVANATWRAPVQVSANGVTAYGSDVVAAPDGSTTAIWYQKQGSDWYVAAATRLAGETVWSAPAIISPAGVPISRNSFDITSTAEGSVAVTFLGTAAPTEMFAAVRPAGSPDFNSATQLSDGPVGGVGDRNVIGRPDGTFVAGWAEHDSSVRSRVYDGSWQPVRIVEGDDHGDDTFSSVRLSADDVGDTTVMYTRHQHGTGPATVTSRRLASGNVTWGTAEVVEALSVGSFSLDVVSAPNGEVTAIYDVDETPGDDPDVVHANTRGTDGTWGTAVSVTGAGETAFAPRVVADTDSNVTATLMKINDPASAAMLSEFIATRPAGGAWTDSSLMSAYGVATAYAELFPTQSGAMNALSMYSPDMETFMIGQSSSSAFRSPFSASVEVASNVSTNSGPPSFDGNRFGDLATAWNALAPGDPVIVRDMTTDHTVLPPTVDNSPQPQPPAAPAPAPTPAPGIKTTLAPKPIVELRLSGKRLTVNAKLSVRKGKRCSGTVTGSTRVGARNYRTTLKLTRATRAGKRVCVAKGVIKLRKTPARSAKVKIKITGKQVASRALLAKRVG